MTASTIVALNAIDASANSESAAIPASRWLYVSMQSVMTGASTGAVKIQISNDIVNPVVTGWAPTNWKDLTGAASTINTAGVSMVEKKDLCYAWVKVVYTKNNGSAGALSVNLQMIGS